MDPLTSCSCWHTVLEERSVTRAARRLHLTQPAVSNALARLRGRARRPARRAQRANAQSRHRARPRDAAPGAALGGLAAAVDPRFDAATTARTSSLADSEGWSGAAAPRRTRSRAASRRRCAWSPSTTSPRRRRGRG
ncbi:MAG: LysR family transcriptional regulator [Deltaproteobacteria bacterium]|nr:LysR family transcriptional regulator [Deltaproteobacteria bacterium]